jgi:4a-hydroxytetrahydrobiopterin dehydratase
MSNLSQKQCVPCEGGTARFSHTQNEEHLEQLDTWNLIEDVAIEKTITCKDFASALKFVNQVGDIAEKEGHHPDIGIVDYKKVRIHLTTHAIRGLSENDFILAAKIDEIPRS